MAMPKSVVKINKDGVKYTSSVDQASYKITQLTRRALIDVGKFVSRKCNEEIQKVVRRLRNNAKTKSQRKQYSNLLKSKRIRTSHSAFQYWVRKKESDLQVGIRYDGWYGVDQELGTRNQPKRGILRSVVNNNIPTIIEIESKYLSALEDDAKALSLIDENEAQGGSDEK